MSFPSHRKNSAGSEANQRRINWIEGGGVGVDLVEDAGNQETAVTLRSVDRYNWLRNSGFWFAQRQPPTTATTYSSLLGRIFGADGWALTNENASATYQRTDAGSAPETGLQAPFYGRFLKITSLGKLMVSQCLPNTDTANLRGKTVRVQLKLKQLVAAAPVVRVGLIQLAAAGTADTLPVGFLTAFNANGTDPGLGTNLAYIAPTAGTQDGGSISGNALSCTLGAAWARFGCDFVVPSDCENLIVAVWSNAQLAATNGFAIAEFGLYDGAGVSGWSPETIPSELDKVQRYYQKSFAIDQAPQTGVGLVAPKKHPVVTAGAVATSWNGSHVALQPRMRTSPQVTFFNPSAANAFVRNVTLGTDATATTVLHTGETGFGINCTGLAAWVVGNDGAVHWTADAEL